MAKHTRQPATDQPIADPEAERAVLGALCIDPARIEGLDLRSEHFLDPVHGILFQAMQRLHSEGIGADMPALRRELQSWEVSPGRSAWAEIGAAYVGKLIAYGDGTRAPLVNNIRHNARIVREKWQRRQIAAAGAELVLGAQNGKATAELLDALRGSVAAIENLATGDAFEILNGPALSAMSADVVDVIEWTITAGQPFVISGPRKAQKTTIALDAAISIVSGRAFLGCREVLQSAPVLFLSGESGLPTIRETALRICRAKGIDLAGLDGLHVSTQLPLFESAESLQRLRRTIKVTGAGALFVDPVYLCMSGADAANLFSMGAQLRPISELCQQVGATLVLCHHNKRTTGRERFSPPELDDIAWSGFAEFARGWLLIDRREAYQPGTGVHKLWLSIGGSAGHSSLLAVDICEGLRSDPEGRRWDVVVQTAEQAIVEARRQKDDRRAARRADQQGDDRRRLLEALRRCPKGDTLRKLRELAGLSGERAGDAIRCLIGEGRAEQAKVMKNGREEDGYRSTGK